MNQLQTAITLVCVISSVIGCKAAKPPPAPLTAERRELHVKSFDQVWETVQKQHWDANLNGVDWNSARAELRPKVEAAGSDAEARAAMTELIGRLKQSHFSIIPSEAYARLDELPKRRDESDAATQSAQAGFSGLHIRAVGNDAIITKVEPGSPADTAGVHPGWLVLRAGKFRVEDVLHDVRNAYAKSSLLPAYEVLALNSMFEGNIAETIEATFRDGDNKVIRKSIKLAPPTGTPSKFMNLPTFYVKTEVREVAEKIGYIAVSAFFGPDTVPKFRTAVEQFRDADGIILDLRGNPGGIGFMANGMAGYLVDRPNLQLGEMTMRTATVKFMINPQPFVYTGPVAVLVDEASMSTSEILAGGLQDIGRARIFGTPTPGAALPSRVEKLPNGDGFQYAFANYVSAKGQALEGKGVQPDEVVQPQRAALLAGRDSVIDAAVKWLKAQKK